MIVEFTLYADLELIGLWQSENPHTRQKMQCNIVDECIFIDL